MNRQQKPLLCRHATRNIRKLILAEFDKIIISDNPNIYDPPLGFFIDLTRSTSSY